MRWPWVVGFLLAIFLMPAAHAADANFFNDTFGDFQEELAKAKAEGKQGIFIFFEMEECPFCHYMRTNVLNQAEVQAYYREHFLSFPLDINGDVEIKGFDGKTITQKAWAEQYRVRATPMLAFFDLDGKLIHRFTGRTSGVDEFLWLGEFVAKGLYKTTTFSAYKREKQKS